MLKTILWFIAILLLSPAARADYYATGTIKGNVCRGFILESCRTVPVVAVKGEDGTLHKIATRFAQVDDHDEKKGRCWIRTKSKGGGLLSWGANAVFQPEFYTTDDEGNYEKVDVEYLTFRCDRR